MKTAPAFEFHVSRAARERYGFGGTLFSVTGNVLFANMAACREFANRMNQVRDAQRHPERAVNPGALNAMALIDEVLHVVVALYREQRDAKAMLDALAWFEGRVGGEPLHRTLLTFVEHFPSTAVYRGEDSAAEWLAGSTAGVPHRAVALEEMMMLWLANLNSGFRPFAELFDDESLAQATKYDQITGALGEYFSTRPPFGPDNQNLVDMLRAPALESPDSLEGQLKFIRRKWSALLGDVFQRLLTALDVLKEEEIAVWMRFHPPGPHFGGPLFGDSSTAAVPKFVTAPHEYERFSPDVDWMPKTVLMAKSVYVWLHQLSGTHRRDISTLDQIPDEELSALSRRGFNALWLIGIWERSRASQRIKQMTGNPEAAASAYSLYEYAIAADLGGEAAYGKLRDRAAAHGIRLASDMVPNHMGIDSRWVIEHPDWFLSLPYSPYPSYTFNGPDVSGDDRVEIKIEDHYFNRTDAAVVFRRRDRWTDESRYIYHGNDGTSFPWNDTAQLNYLKPEVREAVIQTILGVARRFPIIRFDAAMTLTKQHYQRLWFPVPGTGGAIPSRAEHGLTKAEFDAAMPHEFWREVVDRVAAEVPGTLLLAEAFWLLEGYFVRTLGMHRVYNSAFMNMLRDEENANYRSVLKNTLEFDPEVLKRYVNFVNNPDERTAVDQFGKGDKYFGVCTLLATLPGLPMFGHGQIEGFNERYGMEYRRSYHDETPDTWLVARHEREISPLLHRRALFAEVREFLLYDFFTDEGWVNEDVYAFSNRLGEERALIVYHNRYGSTSGWVRSSCAYSEKTPDGGKRLRQRTIGEAFGLSHDPDGFVAYRNAFTGLEYLQRSGEVAERGIHLELGAYRTIVLLDWRDFCEDDVHPWGALCDSLAGEGVSGLQDALHALELKPVHDSLRAVLHKDLAAAVAQYATATDQAESIAAWETLERQASDLVEVLLQNAGRYLQTHADDGENVRRGDLEASVQRFRRHLRAALHIPQMEWHFSAPWPKEARDVLTATATPPGEVAAIWATVLAWCAVDALGDMRDPEDCAHAAADAFDRLRLREPMAEAFAAAGMVGEGRWRAAARVRADFAHAAWSIEVQVGTGRPAATPLSWLHDPDVAWLIGVHEYQGERYFNKERYERLLWWLALPRLLDIASEEEPDRKAIAALEAQLKKRMKAAEDSGYRIEALLESGD